MIERKYTVVKNGDNMSYLKVEFQDKKYEFLTEFFFVDGATIGKIIIKKIHEIQRNEIDSYEITGNAYNVILAKENARICNIFNEENYCFEIGLADLLELTEEWLKRSNNN